MYRSLFVLAAIILQYTCTQAQILPAEHSKLNYRMAGFHVPAQKKTDTYVFRIAKGIHNNTYTFNKNIVIEAESDSNSAIVTLPQYDTGYTWQVTYKRKKKTTTEEELHHFSTLPVYDTMVTYRLRVIDKNRYDTNLLFFHDYTRSIYDLEGNRLWFLPYIPGKVGENSIIRDLKATSFGTITFMADDAGYEIDYNANILWQTPDTGLVSGDTSEFFHHEFTRLPDGHYMIAGEEHIYREIPDVEDTSIYTHEVNVKRENGKFLQFIKVGTLIEYDEKGRMVWNWKSSDHFTDADYFTKKMMSGVVNPNTHMNSFSMDMQDSVIYISYRDINMLLKIGYPSGNVISRFYGSENGGFSGQHTVGVHGDELLLFNNNSGSREGMPRGRPDRIRAAEEHASSVMILKDNDGQRLEKIWEFRCDIDTEARNISFMGGSMYQLPGSAYMVGMGGSNRMFIVNREKEVLWNAVMELYANGGWKPFASYRVSPFTNEKKEYTIYKSIKK